jgi:hypothetical protein
VLHSFIFEPLEVRGKFDGDGLSSNRAIRFGQIMACRNESYLGVADYDAFVRNAFVWNKTMRL